MNASEKTDYLIEELKILASSHDKLRELMARLFNYFLLISVAPITILSYAMRDRASLSNPMVGATCIAVGFGNILLALALVEARFEQYRYARAVNLIRKYYSDQNPKIKSYLYLPTDAKSPRYENLGFVQYQTVIMVITAVIYLLVGPYSLDWPFWNGPILAASGAAVFKYMRAREMGTYTKLYPARS
jgi:hypothetical protein